jgi:hypothetical protein
VASAAGVFHGGALQEGVSVHQATACRLGLAHVAITATRVAALAGLPEYRLGVGPATGGNELEIILVAAHGEVQTRFDVGDFLLVARRADGIGVPRWARHQSLVVGLLAAGLWITLMAGLAAIQRVRTCQERWYGSPDGGGVPLHPSPSSVAAGSGGVSAFSFAASV